MAFTAFIGLGRGGATVVATEGHEQVQCEGQTAEGAAVVDVLVGADDCSMAAMCCKYHVFMSSLLGVAVVVVVVVGLCVVVSVASDSTGFIFLTKFGFCP